MTHVDAVRLAQPGEPYALRARWTTREGAGNSGGAAGGRWEKLRREIPSFSRQFDLRHVRCLENDEGSRWVQRTSRERFNRRR